MRYLIAGVSGIIFGYVTITSVALIVVNALNEGVPITAINVTAYPIFLILVIPACIGSTSVLLLLAAVGYTRPTTMLGMAGGALVGMLIPVPFAKEFPMGFFYAIATILSAASFGWIGSLGGNIIAKAFGRFGVDEDRIYWEDFR